jgi:hypothetical protein
VLLVDLPPVLGWLKVASGWISDAFGYVGPGWKSVLSGLSVLATLFCCRLAAPWFLFLFWLSFLVATAVCIVESSEFLLVL